MVQRLREAHLDERLSLDTFTRRLDLVFSARTRAELDRLLADIAKPSWLTRLMLDAINGASRWTWQVGAAWREPRTPRLVLPRDAGVKTLGRSATCDFIVQDASVSRVHATLEHVDGRWQLRDAGSVNGTWLNGWRLTSPVDVRPGDELQLGACRFVLDRH